MSTEPFKSEDAVDKGYENAVLCRVCLLPGVVVPGLFPKGDFEMGELTGQGGFLSGLTISYTDRADMTTIWADSSL